MSQHDPDVWAHFNVRCERWLRNSAEELAKKSGQSLGEFVRRAIKEKVERDSGKNQLIDSDSIQSMVDASVKKALSDLGLTAGMVHGLAFAENPVAGFEKVELRARGKY